MPGTITARGDVAGLLAIWGLAVAGGMLLMDAYAAAPGDPGAPPARWPAGATAPLDGRRPTPLIFLHPRCPCSRASLGELSALLDRCGDRVAARAVLYRPRGDREGWFREGFRSVRAEVPGLDVRPDDGGEEARRFAVATSGHVLLYAPDGALLFSGGITAGRGWRGDNLGRSALVGRILRGAGGGRESPVFGCGLATPRSGPYPGRRP